MKLIRNVTIAIALALVATSFAHAGSTSGQGTGATKDAACKAAQTNTWANLPFEAKMKESQVRKSECSCEINNPKENANDRYMCQVTASWD